MTQIQQPSVTVSRLSAATLAGLTPQKILIVAQKLAAGSAVDGALNENILNTAANTTLSGASSMGEAIYNRVRDVNGVNQVDAIYLDDEGGATQATGTVTITGPATEDGTLTYVVGSKKNNSYDVPVISGDSETDIADALVILVTADTTAQVTIANIAGVVTFTARQGGTYGNTIGLAVYGAVAGVTNTIVTMASGATDPAGLSTVFDVIGDQRYQTIIWPYAGDTDPLTDLLDPRFNPTNDILDGVGFVGLTDTVANLLTYASPLNSASLFVQGDLQVTQSDYAGPAALEIPVIKVAEFAGIRALRKTDDVSISQFVITSNGRDAFGGPGSNSKPYFNTPFFNIDIIDVGKGFTQLEIEQLRDAGVSVIGNNRARNTVIAGEAVTTRTTDTAGNPDITFSFLNYVDTSSAIAEFYDENFRKRYAQYRLTGGALVLDRDVANELSIRGFCKQLYQELGGPDFVLVQIGQGTVNGEEVDLDASYDANLTVTVDLAEGKVTASMTVFVIVQARTFLIPITIAFTPEG